MDILKRLKQEFSGNALKDIADQTRVYVKERHEAAYEIERLRGIINDDRLEGAADEIERLRKENAELKELLQATVDYTGAAASSPNLKFYPSPKWHLVTNGEIQEITIGKTTGDE